MICILAGGVSKILCYAVVTTTDLYHYCWIIILGYCIVLSKVSNYYYKTKRYNLEHVFTNVVSLL